MQPVALLLFPLLLTSPAFAEPAPPNKKGAVSKKLLRVEKQISDPLRKTEREKKELEQRASQPESIKADLPPSPIPQGWQLTCQPNQDSCVPEKREKFNRRRSDGLELK